jgi:hypothetical protein
MYIAFSDLERRKKERATQETSKATACISEKFHSFSSLSKPLNAKN